MRLRGRLIALLLVALGLFVVAGTILSTSIGCGRLVLRVTGQLVDATTGLPLAGVDVRIMRDRRAAQASPAEVARWWREEQESLAARGPLPAKPDPFLLAHLTDGHGTTDAEGRFELWWTEGSTTSVRMGVESRSPDPDQVSGRVLRVEIGPDRTPQVVDLQPGSWTRHPREDVVWGHWALGAVRVPGS